MLQNAGSNNLSHRVYFDIIPSLLCGILVGSVFVNTRVEHFTFNLVFRTPNNFMFGGLDENQNNLCAYNLCAYNLCA